MSLNTRVIHEQLSAIMSTLSRAALSQMCAAVDQGFSALHAELLRQRRDNDELRKKLHLIQSIVVHSAGGGGDGPAEERALEAGGGRAGPGAQRQAAKGPAGGSGTEEPQEMKAPEQEEEIKHESGCGAPVEEDVEFVDGRGAPTPRADHSAPTRTVSPEAGSSSSASGSASVFKEEVEIKHEEPGCGAPVEEDVEFVDGRGAPTPRADHSAPTRTVSPEAGSSSSASGSTSVFKTPRRGRPSAAPPPLKRRAASKPPPEIKFGPGHHWPRLSECELLNFDVQEVEQHLSEPPSVCGPIFCSSSVVGTQTPALKVEVPAAWSGPFGSYQPENSDAFGLKVVSVSGSLSENSTLDFSNLVPAFGQSSEENLAVRPRGRGRGRGSGLKRFNCTICQKVLTTAQALESHVRIHTGERPFKCEECGKRFTQACHLKSHGLSIHGNPPHPCPVCGRGFSSLDTMQAHMKRWHPN